MKTMTDYALEARERAYAPYSGFSVGAALQGTDGRMFLGCNVENASYSMTICAERNAVLQAIAAGQRSFRSIAIVGGKTAEEARETPCVPLKCENAAHKGLYGWHLPPVCRCWQNFVMEISRFC